MKKERRELLQLGGLTALGLTSLVSAASADHHEGESKEKHSDGEHGQFIHVFYFKFKPEVKEEEIEPLMKELAALPSKIPELKDLLVGKNINPRTKDFMYAQVSFFEKEEHLEIYEKHPEHMKLVRKIGPKMAGGIAADYEPISPE